MLIVQICVKLSPQNLEVSGNIVLLSCLWRTICRLGSDVAVLVERYGLVVVYFDTSNPLRLAAITLRWMR